MSMYSMVVGMTVPVWKIFSRRARRSSGTVTTPTLGSMVQNG